MSRPLVPERYNPTPKEQNVVLVGPEILHQAEALIRGCEDCSPDDAEVLFATVLARVTGNDPTVTDYIFVEAVARCPRCQREINEKTVVKVA